MSRLTKARTDLAKVTLILDAALASNAQRPIVMDIREVTSFADAFVLLSGRSDRQVRAIGESIIDALRESGDVPLGIEGLNDGRWVLIDCNDVIVHVFQPEFRDLYALERLWSDAPNIDLLDLGFDSAALEAAGLLKSGQSGRSPEFIQ